MSLYWDEMIRAARAKTCWFIQHCTEGKQIGRLNLWDETYKDVGVEVWLHKTWKTGSNMNPHPFFKTISHSSSWSRTLYIAKEEINQSSFLCFPSSGKTVMCHKTQLV